MKDLLVLTSSVREYLQGEKRERETDSIQSPPPQGQYSLAVLSDRATHAAVP